MRASIQVEVPSDNVFDVSCKDVAIVRQSCSERWAVVEDVLLAICLGFLELCVECIDLCPVGEDRFLLLGEGNIARHCTSKHRSVDTAGW